MKKKSNLSYCCFIDHIFNLIVSVEYNCLINIKSRKILNNMNIVIRNLLTIFLYINFVVRIFRIEIKILIIENLYKINEDRSNYNDSLNAFLIIYLRNLIKNINDVFKTREIEKKNVD